MPVTFPQGYKWGKDFLQTILVVSSELQKLGAPDPTPSEFDYFKAGCVDSLSLLRFVITLEAKLGVTVTDEDILQPAFRTFGGLVNILFTKMVRKEGKGAS